MITETKKNASLLKIKEQKLRDNWAPVYDRQISQYQHYLEINNAIKKIDPKPGDVILDVGCGTGRITSKILEKGCKVVAIDFSGESLKICKSRCNELNLQDNIYLIKSDACNLPLKANIFDKCFSSEVFEQIPSEEERLRMLYELHRILKINGKLFLTTFNHSLRKLISGKKETPKNATLYFYRYNYFELKKTITYVFKNKIKIVGILNLTHWIPLSVLNKSKPLFSKIDNFIEKTPFSYPLAHLLSVECEKVDHKSKRL